MGYFPLLEEKQKQKKKIQNQKNKTQKKNKPQTQSLCVYLIELLHIMSLQTELSIMQQLTIKGLLGTPTAATCPKEVTRGFACPNAAKLAPWKEK